MPCMQKAPLPIALLPHLAEDESGSVRCFIRCPHVLLG